MVETLKDLGDISRKLNEKSNNLNTLISSTNEHLEKLNLGVEIWLDRPMEATDPWLGYAHVEGRWQLALRTASEPDGGPPLAHWAGTPSSAIPLLKASRTARLRAMGLLPHLLDALRTKASELIASIEVAEKTVVEI